MGPYEKITYTVTDGRAEILLDRPDVLNAYDDVLLSELDAAVEAAMSDDTVRVVLLSGRGRAFCSGVDLNTTSDHAATRQDHEEHRARVDSVYRQLHKGSTPTIAAVNGPAIGAGFGFALSCDLRIIAQDAYFRDHHLNVGLAPSVGAGWLLPRLIGDSKAREIVLLSDDVSPEEARDAGLVTAVVDPGDAMTVARSVASRLQEKSPIAVRSTIDLMSADRSFEEYIRAASEWQWRCKTHADQKETNP